jgi:hypothetical protein
MPRNAIRLCLFLTCSFLLAGITINGLGADSLRAEGRMILPNVLVRADKVIK